MSRRTPAQKENGDEIASDVASLGFDLPALVEAGKLFVNYVRIERSEIEETGEYDLEGLFVRLDHAIRATGAKRIVLDTIDSLFSGLGNANILRAELRRLFRRLKDKGLTGVYTAAAGGEVSRLASRHQRVYVSHRPPASRPRRTSPRKPKPASHRSWIPGS